MPMSTVETKRPNQATDKATRRKILPTHLDSNQRESQTATFASKMVKILSIALARLTDEELKNNNGEPVILSQAYEVSEFGFFQRGGVREMLTFFTRTFVKRTGKGKRQCVEHEGHLCHVQMRANGLACCIITDQDYPSRCLQRRPRPVTSI